MAISAIVVRGYGAFGSVNKLPTLGFGIAAAYAWAGQPASASVASQQLTATVASQQLSSTVSSGGLVATFTMRSGT